MSGLDLARRALELLPTIKVIFATGYASSFNPSVSVPGELLQKPYRDEDLSRAVRRAFGDAASAAPGIVTAGSLSAAGGG